MNRRHPLQTLLAIPLLVTGFQSLSAEEQHVCECATPVQARLPGVPKASEVTMRSLRFHPSTKNDPHDSFKALADFYVTRLEWTYIRKGSEQDRDNVARVKASGCLFGGATSGETGIHDGQSPDDDLAIKKGQCVLDLNGLPIVPVFKKTWKGIRSGGCVNNPAYREGFLADCLAQIDAGAEILQRDEASGNHSEAATGSGCFCAHCVSGFRGYLKSTLSAAELAALGVSDVDHFDYAALLRRSAPLGEVAGADWSDLEAIKKARNAIKRTPLFHHFERFQAAAMTDFYRWLRPRLDSHAGRRVTLSCNNTSFQDWEQPFYQEFDFGLSELMVTSAQPARIYERAQRALSLGKVQIFGTPKTMGKSYDDLWMLRLRRQVIATAYASGGLSPVPWDSI